MKHVTIAIALFSVLALRMTTDGGGKSYAAEVFYFPLFANTFESITSKSIEGKYDIRSSMHLQLNKLLELLSTASETSEHLDDGQIRLKIRLHNGRVVLMDEFGVLLDGKKTAKVSKNMMKAVRSLVLSSVPDN